MSDDYFKIIGAKVLGSAEKSEKGAAPPPAKIAKVKKLKDAAKALKG